MDCIRLSQDRDGRRGFFEHGDELSGSMKGGEFID